MLKIILMLLTTLSFSGCSSANSLPPQKLGVYKKISAEDAKQMLDTKKDIILLDVRTQSEYDENRIDGSILIPDNEIETKALQKLPDKNAEILVYCRSGRRSKIAAEKLISLGYTRVYDFGGIIDWPYETLNGN